MGMDSYHECMVFGYRLKTEKIRYKWTSYVGVIRLGYSDTLYGAYRLCLLRLVQKEVMDRAVVMAMTPNQLHAHMRAHEVTPDTMRYFRYRKYDTARIDMAPHRVTLATENSRLWAVFIDDVFIRDHVGLETAFREALIHIDKTSEVDIYALSGTEIRDLMNRSIVSTSSRAVTI